jgi:hypothetical protein
MASSKSEVFNNTIGYPYNFDFPRIADKEANEIIASLFEQLLIFDRVIISTNRLNFALAFLIQRLGINVVENLLNSEYIKFMIWSPTLMTGTGRQQPDGSIDESTIYGQPPIAAGALTADDLDPEKNIKIALDLFDFHRDRKRIFTRKAINHYIIPNGMEFSSESAKFVIDAYKKNNLSGVGLPFVKEPEQLDLSERRRLLNLSHTVIETSLLSKYGLKSYENYEHFKICEQSLSNIGKAYNISGNTSAILQMENLPNLKALYLTEKLNFESVFKIRHLSNAKYFRKWINEVGESGNAQEITREYINQIKGNSRFFESTKGKLVRTLGMLGIGSGAENYFTGIPGIITGGILSLLDTFLVDSIVKGKNPSMFVETLRNVIDDNEHSESNN